MVPPLVVELSPRPGRLPEWLAENEVEEAIPYICQDAPNAALVPGVYVTVIPAGMFAVEGTVNDAA